MTHTPMINFKRVLILVVLLLGCLAVDQGTKHAAERDLSSGDPIVLAGGLLRFEYVENTGAFLSLGASLPEDVRFQILVLSVGIFIIAALSFIVLSREMTYAKVVTLSLVVGGGLGNLLDRVTNDGAVRDFIVLNVGPLRTGVFNAADLFITIGTLSFVLLILFGSRRRRDLVPPA